MPHDHADHGGSVDHGHEGAFDSVAMVAALDAEGELSGPLTSQAIASASRLFDVREVEVRRVLDLGCGPGVATTALAEAFPGATVVAVDGSATMLTSAEDRARRSGHGARVETRQVEMNDELEPLGRFDLVWAAMSLHHVEDEVTTLGRIRARLQPGGVLCVLERAAPTSVGWADDLGRPGLSDRLEAAWGRWFENRRAHLPGAANADRYPEMLSSAGLQVVSAETMAAAVPAPDRDSVRRFVRNLVERTVSELEDEAEPDDLSALSTWIDQHPASSPSVLAGTEVRMSRQLFLAASSA
jgi:trans-aconitate methyltransferase